MMDELQLSLDALLSESDRSPDTRLNGMIAAVAAVIHRKGDVHDLFEYQAVQEGLRLARLDQIPVSL